MTGLHFRGLENRSSIRSGETRCTWHLKFASWVLCLLMMTEQHAVTSYFCWRGAFGINLMCCRVIDKLARHQWSAERLYQFYRKSSPNTKGNCSPARKFCPECSGTRPRQTGFKFSSNPRAHDSQPHDDWAQHFLEGFWTTFQLVLWVGSQTSGVSFSRDLVEEPHLVMLLETMLAPKFSTIPVTRVNRRALLHLSRRD